MSEKVKKSKTTTLALVIAIVALFLSVQERFSTENASVKTINRMITDKVVPEMKRSGHSDTVRSIYDLKHIVVTLEQVKETSRNPEVKTMVDQLQKQIEDLSVKIFVHE